MRDPPHSSCRVLSRVPSPGHLGKGVTHTHAQSLGLASFLSCPSTWLSPSRTVLVVRRDVHSHNQGTSVSVMELSANVDVSLPQQNVEFLNNPAKFLDPYHFRVTFECIAELPEGTSPLTKSR